jgi:pyruvate-ferredoxin/flavodoxin oxidoreductase
MALIAQSATLQSRVPFLHFFDGFRTSHEVAKIEELSDDDIRAMIDDELVAAHRIRRLNPDAPVIRGTAQNPDVFFQAREACNLYYAAVPDIVQSTMDRFAEMTGRRYRLFDYVGAPDAERVVILMGSGIGAAEEAVQALVERGEKVGILKVRLFRPFSVEALIGALPASTRSIAVLDRTKEPGAIGEPLYQDVITAIAEQTAAGNVAWDAFPKVIGGRYGLSSKEFTPSMVGAVFAELAKDDSKVHFTVGIVDDVTNLSLSVDEELNTEPDDVVRAVFFGLGADGTVGANKNSVKIIGENTDLYAQGHFVYDSKKSGAITVSHLRFGPRPITSTYEITRANFVACHQFNFLEKMAVLEVLETQQTIIDKNITFYVVDGVKVAREVGLGGRINTVLQTCFFSLAGILPAEDAIREIKEAIEKSYGKFGQSVLDRNFAAVDAAVAALEKVEIPDTADSTFLRPPPVPEHAPDFVQRVTAMMIAGKGDLLPVSALPVDGTFPTATTQFEKRSIAQDIPIWDPDICIDCAKCALVCPHAAIRMKVFDPAFLEGAPSTFLSKDFRSREMPGNLLTIQVAPDDCTGCGVCVDVCPAKSKEEVKHKSINMMPKLDHLETEQANFDFFLAIPEPDRKEVRLDTVKGSQMVEPLFEYSGACAGCGETPYIKLMTQMFGDRATIANATGCSSIYGGNLPTTPYSVNADGRGPTWANSLFEDNAEFGLGLRLAQDQAVEDAKVLVEHFRGDLGDELVTGLLAGTTDTDEAGLAEQRTRIDQAKKILSDIDSPESRRLLAGIDTMAHKSVWIVGGDGWAYDIGFGGLDHVLASGRNVNILVLDTEVYSNTGGQASKATPRGAVAKFAAGGKPTGKKDLGMIAQAYGNVYVAQIAVGANNTQTVKAFAEAEAYTGTSLIIAYSQCIAHGIDMETGMSHQKEAVESGYWPLFRFDPTAEADGKHSFHLDSRAPKIPFKEFAMQEARYAMLARTKPEEAERLFEMAQDDINNRWHLYEQIAEVDRIVADELEEEEVEA